MNFENFPNWHSGRISHLLALSAGRISHLFALVPISDLFALLGRWVVKRVGFALKLGIKTEVFGTEWQKITRAALSVVAIAAVAV